MSNKLFAASQRVCEAYLAYGPVDDGRPEGDDFEAALDSLMKATVGAKHHDSGKTPSLLDACKDALHALQVAQLDQVELGGSRCKATKFDTPIRRLRRAIVDAQAALRLMSALDQQTGSKRAQGHTWGRRRSVLPER